MPNDVRVPRIDVIGYDNGVGLSRDLDLVTSILGDAGFDVRRVGVDKDRRGRKGPGLGIRLRQWFGALRGGRRTNLFIERIRPAWFTGSHRNLLLGNPDFFKDSDVRAAHRLDAVLAKTAHAVPLFATAARRVVEVGFTSEDRRDLSVPRERAFFHLAGRSPLKGTAAIVEAWRRHPEWPMLTLLQHPERVRENLALPNVVHLTRRVDDGELRVLQNRHRFHLCPSETEGFGHHLVEATSVGAVVLTVDAPPMNTLVDASRGILVGFRATEPFRLATRHLVDPVALEHGIERMLALDDAACEAFGGCARAWYEANDRAFRERLVAVVLELDA